MFIIDEYVALEAVLGDEHLQGILPDEQNVSLLVQHPLIEEQL